MIDRPVWDDGTWVGPGPLPASTSAGAGSADVCIVGLGGSGLAAVDEALSLGKSVIGVDAGPIAGEAAGRNGGFLLAGMPLFYHEARDRWGGGAKRMYKKSLSELERILSQPASRHTGSIRVGVDDAELVDIALERDALVADGFDCVEYEGPEGRGNLLSSDGVCNPMRRARDLVPDLAERGARLYEHTFVTSVSPGRVETRIGTIEADIVVVAVDGRLELLFPELKGRVKTARLEMLATDPIEKAFPRAVYTNYGYVYWQKFPDGRLALGGFRDRYPDSSWSTEAGTTRQIQESLDGYLAEIGVDAVVTHRWSGHAAYTEDRLPVYEELRDGVWVVGAYSGHGNVLGSVYARAAVRSAVAGDKELLL